MLTLSSLGAWPGTGIDGRTSPARRMSLTRTMASLAADVEQMAEQLIAFRNRPLDAIAWQALSPLVIDLVAVMLSGSGAPVARRLASALEKRIPAPRVVQVEAADDGFELPHDLLDHA